MTHPTFGIERQNWVQIVALRSVTRIHLRHIIQMSVDETTVVYQRFSECDVHVPELENYNADLQNDMSDDFEDNRIKSCANVAMFMSSLLLTFNVLNECFGTKTELISTNVYKP